MAVYRERTAGQTPQAMEFYPSSRPAVAESPAGMLHTPSILRHTPRAPLSSPPAVELEGTKAVSSKKRRLLDVTEVDDAPGLASLLESSMFSGHELGVGSPPRVSPRRLGASTSRDSLLKRSQRAEEFSIAALLTGMSGQASVDVFVEPSPKTGARSPKAVTSPLPRMKRPKSAKPSLKKALLVPAMPQTPPAPCVRFLWGCCSVCQLSRASCECPPSCRPYPCKCFAYLRTLRRLWSRLTSRRRGWCPRRC